MQARRHLTQLIYCGWVLFFFTMGMAAQAQTDAKVPANTASTAVKGDNPRVVFNTNMGDIEIELYPSQAPVSVENFLRYLDEGFYQGTIFHRVIKGFMIQGGGFDEQLRRKPTHAPIKNEAKNGLKNIPGTLAMARTNVVDSATSQFFINVANNHFLDHGSRDFGYAVFGKVVKGLDVIKQIESTSTQRRGSHANLPVKSIVIEKASRKPQGTAPKPSL